MLMVENIVRHHAQPAGDHLSIAANDRFGLALIHQFLHLFRQMQADGDVLLQVHRHLKGALQALLLEVVGVRQEIKLLVQQADQIHHLCWRISSGGSAVCGSVCWVSSEYLASK